MVNEVIDMSLHDDMIESFEEYLDESVGEIRIGSLTYSASQVLAAVDETAYHQAYLDYVDDYGPSFESEDV